MRKTVFALVFSLVGLAAMALPVNYETAGNVAVNFWNAHRDSDVAAISSMRQIDIPFDGMYVFAAPTTGFVIVAADDCVQPILAYSFTSPASTQLNPEVSYWLSTYQEQIDFLRSIDAVGSEEVAAQWQEYSKAPAGDPVPLTMVPPLISTTWDQSPYYNKFCPYDSSAHARTVAGCVATATAQVMKYWNHPAQGTGSHSYTSDYGTLSANFGATTYNWALMPTALGSTSSTAQDNAVATLMYHIGVAIEMEYGTSASGAQLTNYGYSYSSYPSTQGALSTFFGYDDNIQAKYRNNISDDNWKNYIVTELNAMRPVLYAGFDSGSGHCFICDGCNTDETQFHFNWGWSGYYDGYYTLANLALGGGGTGTTSSYTFNLNQQILLGVQPVGHVTPTTPSDTISYCGNSAYYTSVGTSGGPMYWGIMIPADQLSGRNYLKSVQLYVREPGNHTLRVYSGGTTSPSTMIHSQTTNFAAADTNSWKEVLLNSLCPIDTTQNLWVIFYANGLQHPAAACRYTYEPNSDWASTNGTSWSHLQELSSTLVYSWLLRAVTSSFPPEAPPSITISGPSHLTVGTTATFNANASAGATVTWSMPGATPSSGTGASVTFTYANPGTYTVTATATNTSGSHVATQTVAVVSSDDPAHTDTVSYCGNNFSSSAVGTGGGPMYWGIALTSSQLAGFTQLKSVMLYVKEEGSYTLNVYTGGSGSNPGTLAHTQTCIFNAGDEESWREVVLNTTFTIPSGQNLWVTFETSGMQHPAAVCNYTGNTNSDWASTDGTTWNHLQDLSSSLTYSWLLKAVLLTEFNPSTNYTVTVVSDNEQMGTVSGGGTYSSGQVISISATPNAGYRFVQWQDGNTSNPRTVTVTANATYTAYFAATQGIDETEAPELLVYPNPASATVTVSGVHDDIQILDVTGRFIQTVKYSGNPTVTFDISRLPDGLYFLRTGIHHSSLVIKH